MFDEKSPAEPDHPYPGYVDPFPEYRESGPEIPSSDEVPTEVQRGFWWLVVVFNVGVLALSLGPMLMFFREASVNGVLVTATGAATCAYGYRRYRTYRERLAEDD